MKLLIGKKGGVMKEKSRFSFQDLLVWKKAIKFAEMVIRSFEKFESPRRHFRIVEQLEAAATSISMNIAEGKGRQTTKEFIQFLYIARGSLYEVITLLIILRNLRWLDPSTVDGFEKSAEEISKMLNSLIKSMK